MPKRMKSKMMRQSFHPYLIPPHWRAIKKHVIAGTTRIVPRGSSRLSFSFVGRLVSGLLTGSWNPYHVKATQSAPNGILIPKQARQLNASIKAPPIIGAETRPTDEKTVTELVTIGCFDKGKQCLRILMLPPCKELVPRPAIARPRMNIFELVANVHSREPNSKVMMPNMNRGLLEYNV